MRHPNLAIPAVCIGSTTNVATEGMRRRCGAIHNSHLQFVAGRVTFPSAMEARYCDVNSQEGGHGRLNRF